MGARDYRERSDGRSQGDRPEGPVERRRGEQSAVDDVEESTRTPEIRPRVTHTGTALDRGEREITERRQHTDPHAEEEPGRDVERRIEKDADHASGDDARGEPSQGPFPRLLR